MPVFTSSGLPPPGGTGPYMREFAPPGRLGSTTDVLDLHSIAEDMTEHDMYAVSPKQQASWVSKQNELYLFNNISFTVEAIDRSPSLPKLFAYQLKSQ